MDDSSDTIQQIGPKRPSEIELTNVDAASRKILCWVPHAGDHANSGTLRASNKPRTDVPDAPVMKTQSLTCDTSPLDERSRMRNRSER